LPGEKLGVFHYTNFTRNPEEPFRLTSVTASAGQ